MNKFETNSLIIEDQTNISYFNDITSYIEEHEQEILNVFRISNLSPKWKVKFISFKEFENIMNTYYGQYEDYMAGNSNSYRREILLLNIEDQVKYTRHKEADIEHLQKQCIHEFIHACYSEVVGQGNTIHWFNEGLATYLSHQDRMFIDISDTDFNLLLNDFNKTHGKGYTPSYLMVKYLFENYSSEEIYKLIAEPNYLIENTSKIINESVEWINKQLNNKTKK